MLHARQRLSNKEKLAYGIGDSAANFIFQTQISFLLFFYTNVFGIEAAAAGWILLISRFLDALTDPIIGALADRTNTKWGHYRPWVLYTAIPLAIALVLCYTTPPFSMTGKLIWAIATYNLLTVLYAANNIPYCAMSGVITADSQERTGLASWRFVCAMAAAIVVNAFTLDLVKRLGGGNERLGYPLTMALWGALTIIFFGITFAFTKERVAPDPKQRSSLWQDASDLWRNGPWFALFALAVLINIQLAMRSGAMVYYFKHYLLLANVFPWINNYGVFTTVGLTCTIIGVALAKPLVTRFGKRTTFRACLFLSSILMAAFVLVPPDSLFVLLGLQIALQLAFGPTIPILWAMMADVVDYSEWSTGRRSTAWAFASIIFAFKVGVGVGGWLNGLLLERFDYSANGAVSASAILGIVRMISVFPATVCLLACGVLFSYRLDDRFVLQIEQGLRTRRDELNLQGEK